MPYRRKFNRRRNYRRRRKDIIYRNPSLAFPPTKFAKLRYTEAIVLDVGVVGVISKYVFRANGCYDPNVTGSGHQPMLWDQITQFYNHYVVAGAKITVKAYSSDDAATVPNLVGIMVNDDATTPSSFNEVIEQRTSKYSLVHPSQHSATVSNTFSAKKFFNISDIKDNYDRLGSPISADPDEAAFFTVYALPMNASTDTGAFNCLVTIDYSIHFSEPRDMSAS